MKVLAVTIPDEERRGVRADTLKVGQLGRVLATCRNFGEHHEAILMAVAQSRLVSLNDPAHTWDYPCSLEVDILPPGTQITMRTEV